ncbi:MAG: helix-turn-helix transcriptional regulator [Oscillospiraceae bacterium]|nr:helix-turn-helix transcriptional regulator [Oscillospiraceae bacterium]
MQASLSTRVVQCQSCPFFDPTQKVIEPIFSKFCRGDFTFYQIFLALCEKNNVAKTRACEKCGVSRTAWRKWENGTMPNGSTLDKISRFFNVSVDFLLGTTPEAYLLWSQYSLAEAEKAFEVEKDEEKRGELANQISGLQESIEEQRLRVALLPQEDAAPEGSAANVTGSTAEFIQLFLQSPPEIQDTIVSLLKSVKSLREAADSAPKGKSTP